MTPIYLSTLFIVHSFYGIEIEAVSKPLSVSITGKIGGPLIPQRGVLGTPLFSPVPAQSASLFSPVPAQPASLFSPVPAQSAWSPWYSVPAEHATRIRPYNQRIPVYHSSSSSSGGPSCGKKRSPPFSENGCIYECDGDILGSGTCATERSGTCGSCFGRDWSGGRCSGEPRGCTSCSRVCRNRGNDDIKGNDIKALLSKIESLDDKIKKLNEFATEITEE